MPHGYVEDMLMILIVMPISMMAGFIVGYRACHHYMTQKAPRPETSGDD